MSFFHTPSCNCLTRATFGLKDYPIPISTSNHMLLDLCNLKFSPQRVEGNFLFQDLKLMRTATETAPTAAVLADSLVLIKGTSNLEGDSSPKVNSDLKLEIVDNLGIRLHSVFAGAEDDWMCLDEAPPGGSSTSSASRPQPEIPLDETPPDVHVILKEPDDAELDLVDA